MNNYILFIFTLLCWAPTWYLIKYQLGYVDPLVSVFYRFIIASLIIFIFLFLKKKNVIIDNELRKAKIEKELIKFSKKKI